jgi:hypothetical protein
MTLYDFIYLIGYGVALLMSIVGFFSQEVIKGRKPNFFIILLDSVIVAFLSWALPIWWIGYKLYVRGRR